MGQGSDSAAKFLHRFAEAWAANDGQVVADFFTQDGSLLNPFGQRADGRAAVVAMYDEYFAGMLAGTSSTIRVENIREMGHSHAFADAEQTIRGSDGDIVLVVHVAAVLGREGEDWRFIDSRPYAFASPPA